MRYDFEWDRTKAGHNRTKHGVSFEEGATVFHDPRMLSLYDQEHSQAEDRWITLGLSATGRVLVVCHTFRQETEGRAVVRIISTRKAGKREIGQYTESEP